MSTSHLRVFSEECATHPLMERAILLSSYNSGATAGNRLGTAGYSYDFVAKLFSPLLERVGKLIQVRNGHAALENTARRVRHDGFEPVHVTFRPFQDATLVPGAHNVVVPAWEFPDLPNAAFDGNPQNDWIATANRCSLVLVGGPFTAKAFDAAGVKTPVRIVPVPTPNAYFDLPPWQANEGMRLDGSGYILNALDDTTRAAVSKSCAFETRHPRWRESLRVGGLHSYRRLLKPCLPGRLEPIVTASLRAGVVAWREQSVPYRSDQGIDLNGVVYTSIFNPDDGRKNWEDTITAFLHALRDCDDATLVLKLIARNQSAVNRVLGFYHRLDIAHRCRIVILPEFLDEAGMVDLARASTFYLTSTRAEGNCLPLMNFLAAGRPAVSPSHTAIADYFDADVGFVVASHPEPCAWPQDSRLRCRTTWHRVVWTSLVEQIRRSYEMAKSDRVAYVSMAQAARDRMRQWSHPDAVWPHLRSAIDLLPGIERTPSESSSCQDTPLADAPQIVPFKPKLARRPSSRPASRTVAPLSAFTPTKVVVSLLSFRPGKIGGTETYLRKLIARLPDCGRGHEITLLMDRDLAAENPFPAIPRAVVDMSAKQIIRARGLEAVSPYRAKAVEAAIDQLRPDVLFFPQQSIFPKSVAVPCVLVVHDLYHLYLPHYLSTGQRMFRQRNYAYSVARADKIIAISDFTKRTIVEHYGVAADDVKVVPHGWDKEARDEPLPDAEMSGRYLYYPAITRPHKNHLALFKSIAALKRQGRFHHRVVLSGIQTPYWRTLRRHIDELGLDETVRHVGYVSYERVQQLYRGADCVVFPTQFEGFGLPVIEACEAGKKILVSRLEVFDEIGVPERFQIDFSDPAQLCRALEEPGVTVLNRRPWTWDESARATMELIDSAAGRTAVPHILRKAA